MNHHKHTSRYGSISLSLERERERHLHLLKITPTTVWGCSLHLPPQIDTPDCAIRRLVGEFIQGRSLQDGQTWPGGAKWFCRLPEVFRSWFFWSARRPFWWGCLFWVLLVVIHNESTLSEGERITWKGGRKEKTATLTDSDAVVTHWQTQCCLCWWWCGCCCLLVVMAGGGLISDSPKIVVQFFKHFFCSGAVTSEMPMTFCQYFADDGSTRASSFLSVLMLMGLSFSLCPLTSALSDPADRTSQSCRCPLKKCDLSPQTLWYLTSVQNLCETSLAYHGQAGHDQTSSLTPSLCTNSSAGTIFWPQSSMSY